MKKTAILSGNQKGNISIIAIWALVIIAIIAIPFARQASQSIYNYKRSNENFKAYQLAYSGYELGILALDTDSLFPFTVDTRSILYPEYPCDLDKLQRLSPNEEIQDQQSRLQFRDEERNININFASLEELAGIQGLNDNIINCIIDWRDSDDNISPGGAETSYYLNLLNPYVSKNSDLESLEELYLVKGVTPEIFDIISKNLTVYGDGRININTCTFQTLTALGFDESFVNSLIDLRKGQDNLPGTKDDLIFKDIISIVNIIENKLVFDDRSKNTLTNLLSSNKMKLKSEYFRIESTGHLEKFGKMAKINAVIHKMSDSRIRKVFWHES